MNNELRFDIVQHLIDSAQAYFVLLDKEIVITSSEFENQKTYILRFFKGNFLHLTGLVNKLSPYEFFEKCHQSIIAGDDFRLRANNDRRTVKRKLKNLIHINTFFDDEIMVQESFVRNPIVCKIATSDNKCTIGFVDAKFNLRPNTILTNNHLEPNKVILKISPIIKEI